MAAFVNYARQVDMKKKTNSRATVSSTTRRGFRGSKPRQNLLMDNPSGLKREIDPSMKQLVAEFKRRHPSK